MSLVAALRARRRVKRELAVGEPELKLVPMLADPQRDFLDVGANDGVYSFYALGHFRRVLAVEAHPGLVDALRRILKDDNQVLATALSDDVGETTLHVPVRRGREVTTRSSLQADANPGFALRAVTVPTTTVDRLGLDRLALIKIDVEGHELKVLRGAAQTLSTAKPVCIVECEERHNVGGIAQAFSFFDDLGYRGYFLHRGALHDGARFDAATLQRPQDAKTVGGGRSPDYVNNFVFVHPDNAEGLSRIRRGLAESA
ncbi:FkbM family methyltransferase [Mycolicibacterium pulveris]|uniref:FkbM family methyltransferase n=1 Tax=Mycolicibacterium pulveris TaxID=36813 RepID=UPI003CE854A1